MPFARSDGRNVLFIHIPKAGGTSIEEWLRQSYPLSFHNSHVAHGLPCVPQHFHAQLLAYLFDSAFFDYSFAVVRNPYWRLLSEYNYRMSQRGRREKIFPMPSFGRWVTSTLRKYEKDNYLFSNHIRPQNEFVFPQTEVFRLEEGLDALEARLAQVLGAPLPAAIARSNRSSSVVDTIDARTAAMIYDFYVKDFETFGYERDTFTRR